MWPTRIGSSSARNSTATAALKVGGELLWQRGLVSLPLWFSGLLPSKLFTSTSDMYIYTSYCRIMTGYPVQRTGPVYWAKLHSAAEETARFILVDE